MKRAALVLALLLAPALAAQETGAAYKLDKVAIRLDGGAGGAASYAAMTAPTGCSASSVPIFLGSPVALGCDSGLTYDAAADTLTVGQTSMVHPVLGLIPLADWCVDSVNGDDAALGTCDTSGPRPLRTLAALAAKTVTAGQTIALARGSHWREQYVIPVNNVTIFAYGTGALPLIDASDVIGTSAWSKTGGLTNVYAATVTNAAGANCFVNVWEDGKYLVRVADAATADATAGTYAVSSDATSPVTISIHATGSGDPASNGKVYEHSARLYGLHSQGRTGVSINGAWTRRNLSQSGSMVIGQSSSVNYCLVSDGNDHSLYMQMNSSVTGTELRDGYNSVTGASLLVANDNWTATDTLMLSQVKARYTSNSPVGGVAYLAHGSGSLGLMSLTDCSATGTIGGVGVGQIGRLVISGGSYAASGANAAIQMEMAVNEITNVAIVLGGGGARALMVEDGGLGGALQLTASGLTVTGEAADSIALFTKPNSSIDIRDSTFTGMGEGISWTQNGASLYARGLTFDISGFYYFAFSGTSTVDSDLNAFGVVGAGARFLVGGANKTYAEWKAYGYDANSTP